MARTPEPDRPLVRMVPVPGLRFPPEDVDPDTAAAMVATGSYLIEGSPSADAAVTADPKESPDAR